MSKVRMETNKGTLIIDLFEDEAPETVKNFVDLITGTKEWTDPTTGEKVKKPYYDGLRFHRVIANFVIQGGDPLTRHEEMRARWGTGGPGFAIKDELSGPRQKHVRGSLSMAHKGPGTGGSQFFICHAPQPHLDRKHTVFGKVVEGLEFIDSIAVGDAMVKVTVEG